jgi:integrase
MPLANDPTLVEIFDRLIQTLALTRRPSTIMGYRVTARRFLNFLHRHYPEVRQLSELSRDPHLLAWFRSLADEQPPLSGKTRSTRILLLRCMLDALQQDGHPMAPRLIRSDDFPRLPVYLPRALPDSDDQRLQNELRRRDQSLGYALLLLRLTGMRIGECLDLSCHSLAEIGPGIWSLHVPLGKLHTDRMIPADEEIRQCVTRLLCLRDRDVHAAHPSSAGLLLPRSSRTWLYEKLRRELAEAAQRAGCSAPVTPHMLRHTFASEMVRLRVSLPVLMKLLGHNSIRMTMRYVQVTDVDVQQEFHAARRNAINPHCVPALSLPAIPHAGVPGILRALQAARHLLELHRCQLQDEKVRRTAHRLNRRVIAVACEVEHLGEAEK